MSSNQAPKNWKQLVRPYKAYLQAAYPAPSNANKQLASRYWSIKAKKSDFNWFEGKPIPRVRADMASAIERMLKPMSYEDAEKKRQVGDTLKAKIFIHIEKRNSVGRAIENTIREFYITIPVNTAEDKIMYRKMMEMTKSWIDDMMFEQEDWVAQGTPKQHRVQQFFAQLIEVERWIADHDIDWFSTSGSSDNFIWWVLPEKSRAHLRPKKASRAGPAYNHASSNCAIESIKLAMAPIDDRLDKIFKRLKTKYQMGVYPDDYEKIANTLGRNIQITFAPSSTIAKKWIESGHKTKEEVNASFGDKKKKAIHIHHWANHATAMVQKPQHEYRYVSEAEMAHEIDTRSEQIYQTGENHITFRNKLDGIFETIQLKTIDGVELELGKTSPQAQLYGEYKKQIVAYSYNDPNREQYDQFVKHGIHFSTGEESVSDYDFDLKNAYSSFDKTPSYRGLPKDITYWFNNPTIEQVKENTGYVLCKFIDPIKQCEIIAWISCAAIDFLHAENLLIEMLQAAFAHTTFDLDTSKFIDSDPELIDTEDGVIEVPKIGKRVFHKLLGLSTQMVAKKRFITSDPIEVFDVHTSSLMLPSCIKENYEVLAATSELTTIGVKYNLERERYSHVAAAIQDYITIEVWRKWVEIKKLNPDATVITSLVDGLRVRSEGFDLSTFKSDNGRWVRKPIKSNITKPQCDWLIPATKAKVAAKAFTPVKWAIEVKPEFQSMLSVAKEDKLSFVDLVDEGYINGLQGYAGSGKSYTIRALLEQFNAIILTPTHSTREDMESRSIRSHLDDELLHKIPCKTYQSVIQRPNSIRDYQVVIIDEAGMLLAEHLNRIIEMVGRKLILLVGDPAQHKPILGNKLSLEAKYLMYRDYINADEELKELYANGSDWERNNMLSYLRYDSTFIEPEQLDTDSDEEHFDRVEALKAEYVEARKIETQKIRTLLSMTFNYETARDVPAFDTYSGGKMLDTVRRADDSEDGKALVQLCADVRKSGISAIYAHCAANPESRIDTTPFKEGESEQASELRHQSNDDLLTSDTNSVNIISFLNSDVNLYNAKFKKTLLDMSDKPASLKLQEELQSIVDDEFASELAKKEAKLKLAYAYVGVDIRIIATSTISMSYCGQAIVIYNGTKGTIKDFRISFDGCDTALPLTKIHTPLQSSKNNPFKRPVLKTCDISPLYAMTSYRAQGRTMSEGLIYVNCSYLTFEMLYVAVSRATRLSQLRFIYSDIIFDGAEQIAGPKYREEKVNTYKAAFKATDSLNLGFKTTNADQLMVMYGDDIKIDNLYHDWTQFNWIEAVAKINDEFSKAMSQCEESENKPKWGDFAKRMLSPMINSYFNFDAKTLRYRSHDYLFNGYYDVSDLQPMKMNKEWLAITRAQFAEIRNPINDTNEVDVKKTNDKWTTADFNFFSNATNDSNYISGPHMNTKRPAKVCVGHDVETFDFCCRMERNGKRAFYWFIGADDMLAFNERMTKIEGVECHELITEKKVGYFIDLDYKLSVDTLANCFDDDINEANDRVGMFLDEMTKRAAESLGWDLTKYESCSTERSRQIDEDTYKVSIHHYTNIAASFSDCAQLTNQLKQESINAITYEQDYENESWVEEMLDGIDCAQYHLNGSMAMPFGSKKGVRSTTLFTSKNAKPLISLLDGIHRDYDDYDDYESDKDQPVRKSKKASKDLNNLLECLDQCKYFSESQMSKTLGWISPDGKSGLLQRKRSGDCKCCNGHHDQDNTLKVFITKNGHFGAVCSRGGKATYFG